MKFKNLLVINAVVALVYGISYQFVPKTILSLYGLTTGQGEILMSRLFGAPLIGIGLLTWFVRNIRDSETQRALILSMLVYHLIGFVITIHGTVTGVMSAAGWTGVGIFLFFTLGYAYFQFIKPETI